MTDLKIIIEYINTFILKLSENQKLTGLILFLLFIYILFSLSYRFEKKRKCSENTSTISIPEKIFYILKYIAIGVFITITLYFNKAIFHISDKSDPVSNILNNDTMSKSEISSINLSDE
jgi:hypothetical protein